MKVFSRHSLPAFTPLENLNINGEKEFCTVTPSISYGLNKVLISRRKCRKETASFLTGFTLVELVLGLAILAVLVAAAIAAMQNITRNAQIARLKATLKSVRSALVIQKTNNELYKSTSDGSHPRVNFWPTYEEVRRTSYEANLANSILDTVLPDNSFIGPPPADVPPPRTPPFCNTFNPDSSGSICYPNPDVGCGNLSNNLVVCTETGHKGDRCAAVACQAAYAYNPTTGEFWANSGQMGEVNW